MNREPWPVVWMRTANAMGSRSRCVRRQVGAVIVNEAERIVATGYNGPPAAWPISGPCSDWCPRGASGAPRGEAGPTYEGCPAIHAEANALLQTSRVEILGGTIYINRAPCWDCAKLIANSGLAQVVVLIGSDSGSVKEARSEELLRTCSIRYRLLEAF
jgi:dCMP deaminase